MTINLTGLSVGLVHDTLDSQLTCSLFATEKTRIRVSFSGVGKQYELFLEH